MRVLQVIPTVGPVYGGAPLSCLYLSRALQHLGVEVTVFSTSIDYPAGFFVSATEPNVINGVKVFVFPAIGSENYWVSPSLFFALRKHVKDYDLVHIHSLYRFHFVVATYYCRKFGTPYVVKPHGSLDPYLYKQRWWLKRVHEMFFERPGLQNAAAVQFTAAEEARLAYSTGIFRSARDHAAVVVPNGVVVPEGLTVESSGSLDFFSGYPHLRNKKVILFLGRITEKKGLDLLLPAFRSVLDKVVDSHLVIAGPDNEGYKSKVEGWIAKYQLGDHVTFTGMLHGGETAAAYRAAHVFCLPSYTENFGLAVFEALSHQCPVVISDRVNIWRDIATANVGLVVPCEVLPLSEALIASLLNPAESKARAIRGADLVRLNYSWDSAARKMLEVYRRILSGTEYRSPGGTLPQ